MSSRHRGRGRGGRNPLAPPFQQLPLHQTPTSPPDTRMDEGQASPVHIVPAPPSSASLAREIQPFEYPAPRDLAPDIIIIIISHYAYGARGYEAATNIHSWYASRARFLIPS